MRNSTYPILNVSEITLTRDDLYYIAKMVMEGVKIDKLVMDTDHDSYLEVFMEMSEKYVEVSGTPRNRGLMFATSNCGEVWFMSYDNRLIQQTPKGIDPMDYESYSKLKQTINS